MVFQAVLLKPMTELIFFGLNEEPWHGRLHMVSQWGPCLPLFAWLMYVLLGLPNQCDLLVFRRTIYVLWGFIHVCTLVIMIPSWPWKTFRSASNYLPHLCYNWMDNWDQVLKKWYGNKERATSFLRQTFMICFNFLNPGHWRVSLRQSQCTCMTNPN